MMPGCNKAAEKKRPHMENVLTLRHDEAVEKSLAPLGISARSLRLCRAI